MAEIKIIKSRAERRIGTHIYEGQLLPNGLTYDNLSKTKGKRMTGGPETSHTILGPIQKTTYKGYLQEFVLDFLGNLRVVPHSHDL